MSVDWTTRGRWERGKAYINPARWCYEVCLHQKTFCFIWTRLNQDWSSEWLIDLEDVKTFYWNFACFIERNFVNKWKPSSSVPPCNHNKELLIINGARKLFPYEQLCHMRWRWWRNLINNEGIYRRCESFGISRWYKLQLVNSRWQTLAGSKEPST